MKKTVKTIKIPLFSREGEVKEGKSVRAEIFGGEKPSSLPALAVRVFLANQRRACAKTKSRGEVAGSGAKLWRQKGTGRARHGDRQAPIFVGGGVAHGPTGRENYKRKLNRKMARQALQAVLSEKLKQKKIFLVEDFSFKKTKEVLGFCQKVKEKLAVEGKMAFLFAPGEKQSRYFRNLKDTLILKIQSLHPYLLLQSETLFLTGKALAELEGRASKENYGDQA